MMSSPLTGDIFQLIGNCDIWFDASLCVTLPCLASLLQVELRLERDTTATIANVLSTFESLDIVRINVISDHHCVIKTIEVHTDVPCLCSVPCPMGH